MQPPTWALVATYTGHSQPSRLGDAPPRSGLALVLKGPIAAGPRPPTAALARRRGGQAGRKEFGQTRLRAFRRREVRTIEPTAPKPMIIIAQVAGSGTAEPPSLIVRLSMTK